MPFAAFLELFLYGKDTKIGIIEGGILNINLTHHVNAHIVRRFLEQTQFVPIFFSKIR